MKEIEKLLKDQLHHSKAHSELDQQEIWNDILYEINSGGIRFVCCIFIDH